MYIENPDEEQNKSQSSSSPSVGAGGGGAAISNGGTSGASGTNTSGGNPSTIQPVQTNQPNQSFATIQDYLGANKTQGENLGNQFTGTISQGIGQAKSAIDTATQNAQNEISAGTVNANPDLINQAITNPTSITGDQGKLAEFQKEYNAEYTGPTSFESSDQYGTASGAANTATQTGQELGTTGGRQQLLQDQFGVYGQGNKGLDQALIQNSSAYPNISPLAQGFNSIQNYLNNAASNTDTAAINAANTTQATKAAATGAFANNLTNFQNQINSEVATAQQQAQTAGSNIQNDIKSGNTDALATDLKVAGVSPENIQTISQYLQALSTDYGQNPDVTNYYTQNPVSTATVATPEDYAKAAAYNQLTGVDYSGVLNPANAAQAGTANPQAINTQNLQDYLQQSLGTQDKSILASTPSLNYSDVNSGKVTTDQAVKSVQQIIDAGKRQGIDPSQNPALQSMESSAFQALQDIVFGHGSLNTQAAQTYAQVALTSLQAKGIAQDQAQSFLKSWLNNLNDQAANHKSSGFLNKALSDLPVLSPVTALPIQAAKAIK